MKEFLSCLLVNTNEKKHEIVKKEEICYIFNTELGIDISRYNIIFERLIEMHMEEESHFDDAIEMMEMIKEMKEDDDFYGIDREKMKLVALLHDIGKSGPNNTTPETRKIVRQMFGKSFDQIPAFKGIPIHSITIKDFLNKLNPDNKETIENVLTYNLGVNIEKETMIEFWRRHADWTWDILRNNISGPIDMEVAEVAASHHILDGKNPVGLSEEETTDASVAVGEIEGYQALIHGYQLLTIIDKYQAFIERSGMTHERAIDILKKIINDHYFNKEETKERYLKILEEINMSAEKMRNARRESEKIIKHPLPKAA